MSKIEKKFKIVKDQTELRARESRFNNMSTLEKTKKGK